MTMTINMKNTNPIYNLHDFGKENLISNKDGSDTYKCSKCGLLSKRPMLSEDLVMKGNLSFKKIYMCNGTVPLHDVNYLHPTNEEDTEFESRLIEVINNSQIPFSSIKVGDRFFTVDPNSQQCKDNGFNVTKGQVAIMAKDDNKITVPLKLLSHEFIYVT